MTLKLKLVLHSKAHYYENLLEIVSSTEATPARRFDPIRYPSPPPLFHLHPQPFSNFQIYILCGNNAPTKTLTPGLLVSDHPPMICNQ